jgi:lysylphosphatidylglycerol synthetase-like protein (DUF2156 family)
MKSVLEKSWVSPFAAYSFLVVSATGILMLFHVKGHAMSYLHQWMGVIFVVAVALHLILNWKGFLSCFENKQSAFAIILAVALMLLLMIVGMSGGKWAPEHGDRGWYPQTHRR